MYEKDLQKMFEKGDFSGDISSFDRVPQSMMIGMQFDSPQEIKNALVQIFEIVEIELQFKAYYFAIEEK